MATFIEQSDLVVSTINENKDVAAAWLNDTQAALIDLAASWDLVVQQLRDNPINIDVSNVNTQYIKSQAQLPDVPAAPTEPPLPQIPADVPVGAVPDLPNAPALATKPVIPPRSEVSIGKTAYDQIFQDAADKIERMFVQRTHEAVNRAASMGHDQMDETATAFLERAADEADARRSEAALANATQYARDHREDQLALIDDEVQNYAGIGNVEIGNYGAVAGQKRDNYSIELQLKLQHMVQRGELEINNYRALSQEQRDSWLRKVQLDLERFRQHFTFDTTNESTRLGFENLELEKSVRPEVERSQHNLRHTEIQLRQMLDLGYRFVEIYAQITTALMATSDVTLGSSVSIGLSGSVDPQPPVVT